MASTDMQVNPRPPRIRPVRADDLPSLREVIDLSGLFPGDLLDGMVAPFLASEATDGTWLTAELDGPVAVAYYVPEAMTVGTWNVLLIAVHPDVRSQGIGAALMAHIEGDLSRGGARVLLVETSGERTFERTRAFYLAIGYEREATIRDFYDAGQDKVVFSKALGGADR